MSTQKLTLSIDAAVTEKAKRYAAAHGTSLSRLFANYLNGLPGDRASELTPRVSRLAGVLPPQADVGEYQAHLREKCWPQSSGAKPADTSQRTP